MLARKLLATATLTAALAFGTVAMAQMTNDTMGGTNRSGMQSGQPMMQSGAGDDAPYGNWHHPHEAGEAYAHQEDEAFAHDDAQLEASNGE